ncbi:MAG: Na+:solute symporter [bacterium]|nr:Na+:solute symporter [bacterium]
MELLAVDWIFIIGFFCVALSVGIWVTRQAGKSTSEFFLSGRKMPWWLLGMSMVATTFSTDTPNLVTDIVRKNGVAGNWVWWAFLLTGMLTVFVYARLWRRIGVLTDVEFYELRYSGRSAAFLRGFRALYLGIFFNIMIMGAVSLAAIKIGAVMMDLSPIQTLSIAAVVTVIFSTLGGFRGVLLTDFLLFSVAMIGAAAAAVVALRLPEVGGLTGMLTHPAVAGKLDMIPAINFTDAASRDTLIFVFLIPLTVQWWASWYPGSEPGGGGYVAQRMLAAKDEKNAVGATLFFNAAHYALRPWPWILVALCSLIIFPDLQSLQTAFPHIPADKIGHDLAYPAMLTYLPHGLLGLVLASLIAAYMSTISTHLNWGSSYVVNDFYKRFIDPGASERRLVFVGRISTVVMMLLAALLALMLQNALQAFQILLQIGAGTGLLFILRWFWWRINAWSEITAMVVSFIIAIYFHLIHDRVLPDMILADSWKFVIGVGVTTGAWLIATFAARPTTDSRLRSFCRLAQPGGPGWRKVREEAAEAGETIDVSEGGWTLPQGLLCMVLACLAVYAVLFSTGNFLYGKLGMGVCLLFVGAGATLALRRAWRKMKI